MEDKNPYVSTISAPVYGSPAPPQYGYERYPPQPGPAPVVQHTTVNIHSEPPVDHIVWSLCCFLYSNPLCLGLAALIFSVRSRDRRMLGDLEGARRHASTARCLNIWATVLVSLAVIGCLIFICVVAASSPRYNYP